MRNELYFNMKKLKLIKLTTFHHNKLMTFNRIINFRPTFFVLLMNKRSFYFSLRKKQVVKKCARCAYVHSVSKIPSIEDENRILPEVRGRSKSVVPNILRKLPQFVHYLDIFNLYIFCFFQFSIAFLLCLMNLRVFCLE